HPSTCTRRSSSSPSARRSSTRCGARTERPWRSTKPPARRLHPPRPTRTAALPPTLSTTSSDILAPTMSASGRPHNPDREPLPDTDREPPLSPTKAVSGASRIDATESPTRIVSRSPTTNVRGYSLDAPSPVLGGSVTGTPEPEEWALLSLLALGLVWTARGR